MTEDSDGWPDAQWPPPSMDFSKPTIARAYDALLGGKDNYAADRALAEFATENIPGLRESAWENRKVLVRGVRHLAADAGVDQFLDLGSGLPTVQNTHQVAQAHNPAARVVYVDIDPLVTVHGQAILADNDRTRVFTGDAREPAEVLGHPETRRLLDFDRPVALMLVGMLHYLSPEVADEVVSAYRDALAPGSYLFVTSLVDTGLPAQQELARITRENLEEGWARRPEDIEYHFGDFELVEPGLTYTALWRPDELIDANNLEPGEQLGMAGIALKKK
ncbi:SAM-dependent methyltransferase [Streptomonospora wellingtoniae]|uniref:SAM-dependent methyltransferase n=1 Tax=Streptomonospora wellingtoniae TaxID=3075544 RepID=A0ABU2KWG1_9ACTN|nr:SAM-dependent methyltransferase [Streptomonospora sp. DSM 45055]MDT0303448.1 SAM-dependent methyltransferase [Streptomonospora sp. DSM 45055]